MEKGEPMIIWNSILTIILIFWIIFTILILAKIVEEIEAIKSWYPFCELVKIKIDKGELNVEDKEEGKENERANRILADK